MARLFKMWRNQGGWGSAGNNFMDGFAGQLSSLLPSAALSALGINTASPPSVEVDGWILYDRLFVSSLGHVFAARGQGDMPRLLNGYRIKFATAISPPSLVEDHAVAPSQVRTAETRAVSNAKLRGQGPPGLDALPGWGLRLNRLGVAELVRLGTIVASATTRAWRAEREQAVRSRHLKEQGLWDDAAVAGVKSPSHSDSTPWSARFNCGPTAKPSAAAAVVNNGGVDVDVDFDGPGIILDGADVDAAGNVVYTNETNKGVDTYYPLFMLPATGLMFGCRIPAETDLDEYVLSLGPPHLLTSAYNPHLPRPEVISGWRVRLNTTTNKATLQTDSAATPEEAERLADADRQSGGGGGFDLRLVEGLALDVRTLVVSQLVSPTGEKSGYNGKPIAILRPVYFPGQDGGHPIYSVQPSILESPPRRLPVPSALKPWLSDSPDPKRRVRLTTVVENPATVPPPPGSVSASPPFVKNLPSGEDTPAPQQHTYVMHPSLVKDPSTLPNMPYAKNLLHVPGMSSTMQNNTKHAHENMQSGRVSNPTQPPYPATLPPGATLRPMSAPVSDHQASANHAGIMQPMTMQIPNYFPAHSESTSHRSATTADPAHATPGTVSSMGTSTTSMGLTQPNHTSLRNGFGLPFYDPAGGAGTTIGSSHRPVSRGGKATTAQSSTYVSSGLPVYSGGQTTTQGGWFYQG